MHRHSAAVRQLFHYKGQLDPLKGDALNKAVRDTTHETISDVFSEEGRRGIGTWFWTGKSGNCEIKTEQKLVQVAMGKGEFDGDEKLKSWRRRCI
ncbi:hypothetical protein Patl1_12912 [Pistacia atlantica]|uniref:Uncharacterized protein n=1 Tax=Pistacia atlantica TaxID=434234 RepID=A0ACC1ASW8_9ROSI|nr:hypothetical protein Patl1_12912 [Pistacia atlantica]